MIVMTMWKLTIRKIDQVKALVAVGILEALKPKLCSTIGMSPVCLVRISKRYGCYQNLPVEHDPLSNGDDALLGLIESGELCQNRIIVVSHLLRVAKASQVDSVVVRANRSCCLKPSICAEHAKPVVLWYHKQQSFL